MKQSYILFIPALAVLCLVVLLLGGCSLIPLQPPHLVGDSEAGLFSIGARGPVTLTFDEPVQQDSVEKSFSIAPPVKGRFSWDGSSSRDQTVSFWPARPLVPGQHYTIHLASGVRGKGGQRLRNPQSWALEVRSADVLYLSPSQAPEIWRVSSDGKNRSQLTITGGSIYDFNSSTDGNQVVYSVKNTQQGYDLWEADRHGKNAHLILPCGTDWCTGPAYSPDGAQIAYSRRRYSGLPGRDPEPPQIWLLDHVTQATEALINDPNVGGSEPDWSPDGRYLAFYDGLSGGVRIQDMQAKTGFLQPSEEGSGIEWSPDSHSLLYLQAEITNELAYNAVYEVDIQTRKSHLMLGDASSPADYSIPDWAPDGEWAAVGWRLAAGGSPNKQLWMVQLIGSQGDKKPGAITNDESSTHASYHWGPGGALLVFQRLQITGSNSAPEVMLWNRQDGNTVLLAEDAFQPQWMP